MITVSGLTKRYGAFTAVDYVDFACRPGRVTGFLGPNGAGKTTTMRVMVGLTPATSGERHHRRTPVRATSPTRAATSASCSTPPPSTPAGPAVRCSRSAPAPWVCRRPGRRDARAGQPDARGRPSARVRNYSLGMRQRLGIAHALLGDPSVLILDEPANGLDPAGIRWMRGLLSGYAERGGTVLLSSHLLHEVEQDRRRHDPDRERPDRRPGRQGVAARRHAHRHPGHRHWTTTRWRRRPRRRRARQRRGRHRAAGRGRAACRSARSPPSTGSCSRDLRPDATALEDLFLELTSDTQRDDVPARSKEPTHDRRMHPHAAASSTSPAPRRSRSPVWSRSSSARWSTPAPGDGC